MRKLFAAALALTWVSSALAQDVPQIGVNRANLRNPTYVASVVGLVPGAAATDVMCINASSTRTVAIRRVEISGLAGTAVAVPFVTVRRATPDTGGTTSPVAIGSMSAANSPSSATAVGYTANPTITDASPAILRAQTVVVPTAAAPTPDQILWYYGTYNDLYDQGADLVKGSTQQFCVNLTGATVSSGLLYIDIEWVEI